MLEELCSLKRDLVLEGKVGKVEEIRKALTKTIEMSKSTAKQRNHLKKVKRKQKSKDKVGPENIVEGKRMRDQRKLDVPTFEPPPAPPAGIETNIDKIFDLEEELMALKENGGSRKAKGFKVLDRVKIKTSRFGKSFAKGLPAYTFGTIMKVKGKVCDVQWDDSDEVDLMKSHTDFLELANDKKEGNALMALYLLTEAWYDDRLNTIRMILPVLEVGAALAPVAGHETTSLPRDFFEALVREDWRDWVLAVKTEMDSGQLEHVRGRDGFTLWEHGTRCLHHTFGRVVLGEEERKERVPSVCDGESAERREGLWGDLFINCLWRWAPLVLLASRNLCEEDKRMGRSDGIFGNSTKSSCLCLPPLAP
jgi:hypothetical protein